MRLLLKSLLAATGLSPLNVGIVTSAEMKGLVPSEKVLLRSPWRVLYLAIYAQGRVQGHSLLDLEGCLDRCKHRRPLHLRQLCCRLIQ